MLGTKPELDYQAPDPEASDISSAAQQAKPELAEDVPEDMWPGCKVPRGVICQIISCNIPIYPTFTATGPATEFANNGHGQIGPNYGRN